MTTEQKDGSIPQDQRSVPDEIINPIPSWNAINYDPLRSLHQKWAREETDTQERLYRRLRLPLPVEVIEADVEARYFLESLEAVLELTYSQYGVTPSSLESYKKYGNKQRANNYGGDPIGYIIDCAQQLYAQLGAPPRNITSVIGEGYPKDWKRAFPASMVSAFDINPLQHARWGHRIQARNSAVKGYLVDAGVAPWFGDLLQKTEPDIVYLSNIVTFLQSDVRQIVSLAAALQVNPPQMIVSSNPFAAPGNDFFARLMRQTFDINEFVLPDTGGAYGARIFTRK